MTDARALTVDLQAFCSADRYRRNIQTPFSAGKYTWATNGHIMIRVPRVDEVPENPAAPDAPHVFGNLWRDCTMRPIKPAKLPPPEKSSKECSDCDGRGTEHDCDDCRCACDECDGTGQIDTDQDDETSVSIGQAYYSLRYIRQIRGLSGLLIADAPQTEEALCFRFDGGEGVLMALRRKRDRHLHKLEL